ncbi:IucA/IucC family protein [Methylobacterium sp. 17Sr1-1]|uniref:IucA/IucC family protein n=1 Tax=Methylobacterium sp. 17Sr1-1 TaxID=2202826 RepID=UPI001FE21B4D|nr:IucA/IucC family protein [Methylobacterium sp. 17Sr1-1]
MLEPPDDRVLRQLAEAVLFEGLSDTPAEVAPGACPLHWRLGGRNFRAPGDVGPFGRPRLAGPVEVAAEGGWQAARLADLVEALPAPPEHRERLLAELRQTVALCRWNAESLPAQERRALPFAALDGALSEGHPYHPCFKARTGFGLDDHAAYGPEAGRAFRLDWLALPRFLVTASLPGDEDGFWRAVLGPDWDGLVERLRAAGHSPVSHAIIPVHPWQMRHLAGQEPWRSRLAAGEAVALGTAGPRYRASQSLRTLHACDDPLAPSVKLSLSVVSTSSLRILDPAFVPTAPALSDWLARIVAGDPSLSGMTILREYAAMIADRDGRLAAIWRESPVLAPGEAALPLNALCALEPDGRTFVAPWLDRYGLAPWLDRLVEVAVLPVWHLLVAHGVALEAHGQNMILVHRDGWPERVMCRDFHESAEYAPDFLRDVPPVPDLGAIDPAHAGPPDDRFHAMRAAATLAELVTDSLFVFNLSEITHLLARRHGLDEAGFWDGLGRCLRRHAAEHGLEDRLARLEVAVPCLRVEALLARKLGLGEAHGSHLAPNALFPPLSPLLRTGS